MTFLLDGPAGPLEALYTRAPNPRGWAALVCHPHPVFGGTMHNRVVYRTAKAFLAGGAHVLRFNFRGWVPVVAAMTVASVSRPMLRPHWPICKHTIRRK